MDAVTLIAVAQIAAFGALAYLFWQVQALRIHLFGDSDAAAAARRPAPREPLRTATPAATIRAARAAYSPAGDAQRRTAPELARSDAAALLARLSELEVDVPAMARRLRKSEEEVRLMLRRQAVRQ
ncbi:MAG: hypothetical protein Kow0010_19340 [Dehalococcoidia bacterium]